MENYKAPDFQQLFELSSALYLVLSPDFKIAAISNAYNPNDQMGTGVNNLRAFPWAESELNKGASFTFHYPIS